MAMDLAPLRAAQQMLDAGVPATVIIGRLFEDYGTLSVDATAAVAAAGVLTRYGIEVKA